MFVYYLSKEILPGGDFCAYAIGPSFLGDSIVEHTNGISRFTTMEGKYLDVNRLLKKDESYLLFTYNNGNYILSKVVEHELETFLDITDSVKTYSLQLYDRDNNPVEDPVNDLIIKLSKSHGVIEFFGIRDFPYANNNQYTSNLKLLSNSLIRPEEFVITWGDIYDFEIGDEFHYQNEIMNIPINGYNRIEYVARQIIGKEEDQLNHSVSYTVSEKRWGCIDKWQDTTYVADCYHNEDTIDMNYTNLNDRLIVPEIMPLEAVYIGDSLIDMLLFSDQEKYNSRLIIRIPGNFLINDQGQWICGQGTGDSYDGEFTYYIPGCGQLFSHVTADYECEYCCNPCEDLVYFKKGDETWGEPLDISDYKIKRMIPKLYPNPATDLLTISYSKDISWIQLYSVTGKMVWNNMEIHSNQYCVDISTFQNGIYIVVIKTASGETYLSKLVVQ